MEKIIIGFSTSSSFSIYSKAIQIVEETKYSHVYIKFFEPAIKRDVIYQSSGLAVNFCNQTSFDASETTISEYEIDITPEKKAEIIAYMFDHVGLPYGFLKILGISIYLILGLIGIKLARNPFDKEDKGLFCSEVGYNIISMLLNAPKIDPSLVKPKDLEDILKNMGVERIK